MGRRVDQGRAARDLVCTTETTKTNEITVWERPPGARLGILRGVRSMGEPKPLRGRRSGVGCGLSKEREDRGEVQTSSAPSPIVWPCWPSSRASCRPSSFSRHWPGSSCRWRPLRRRRRAMSKARRAPVATGLPRSGRSRRAPAVSSPPRPRAGFGCPTGLPPPRGTPPWLSASPVSIRRRPNLPRDEESPQGVPFQSMEKHHVAYDPFNVRPAVCLRRRGAGRTALL